MEILRIQQQGMSNEQNVYKLWEDNGQIDVFLTFPYLIIKDLCIDRAQK